MKQLNQDAYNLLLKANQEAIQFYTMYEGPDWYQLTYDLFKEAPLERMNDFWKIVAYTYSWMPTIPVVKAHLIKDSDALLHRLQELKRGDLSHLQKLFQQLIPVINNSLVGISKVLHFIAPDRVPIIDRNVLRGWNIFFKQYSEYEAPSLPNYRTSLNGKHVSKYMMYRDTMIGWVANGEGQFTMRDLEFAFFELGRNTEKELQDCHPTYTI